MRFVFEYALGSPVAMMLLGAHYVVYSVFAWAIVLLRALTGRFSKGEWVLLAVFALAIALEWAELAIDCGRFDYGHTYGLPRYFGTYAPLLWIWAAKALADLWSVFRRRPAAAWTVRTAIIALLGWMLVDQSILPLSDAKTDSARYDVECAARAIAPIIRSDYAGPARQIRSNRVTSDYYSTRRPVVFSDMSAAAWMVRGQSEGAAQRGCPYPDDYLFVRVGTGYRNRERVDPAVYDYVASVRGDGTVWRLFRRKTTPSAKRGGQGKGGE